MSTINFIITNTTKIDLVKYSQKFQKYVVNQPLSGEYFNLIIDIDYDPNIESEFIVISEHIQCLKNIYVVRDPESQTNYDKMITLLENNPNVLSIDDEPFNDNFNTYMYGFLYNPTLLGKFSLILNEYFVNYSIQHPGVVYSDCIPYWSFIYNLFAMFDDGYENILDHSVSHVIMAATNAGNAEIIFNELLEKMMD